MVRSSLVDYLMPADACQQATPAQLATLWVLRKDVEGAQYTATEGVDLQQTVDKFKTRWMAQEKLLDVGPSLVTLRLVKCVRTKPTQAEELAATELDPFDKLADAGVADGCKLLAFVATPGVYSECVYASSGA
jgi:hypothetical protein